jgi:hypothetical protein
MYSHPRADDAPLFERARCSRHDADLIRMPRMLAATRCTCASLVAATEIKKVERARAPRPASCSKQPDAATPDEKPQPTRMKNDPKSFVLCPYNVWRITCKAAPNNRCRTITVVAALSGACACYAPV